VARRPKAFHALVGDFNSLAPGDTFDLGRLPMRLRFVALLGGQPIRWRAIQILMDAGYVDAFRARHAEDLGHTFPTWNPHARLDYAFIPTAATDRLERCDIVDGP